MIRKDSRYISDDDIEAGINITSEHNQIHKGKQYYICDFTTLQTDDSILMAFQPSGVDVHIVYEVFAQSEIQLNLEEEPSLTISGGTDVTPRNNNRNYDDNSSTTVTLDPTVDTSGTNIASVSHGHASTNEKARATGVGKREREFVLPDDSTYTFEVVSKDDSNVVTYMAQWYEV